jgi:hypothetical protein
VSYTVFIITSPHRPERKTTYYVAQGRAIRRTTVLYTSLEDLIAENDRRYEVNEVEGEVEGSTVEYVSLSFPPPPLSVTCLIASSRQDRLQRGYVTLAQTLPWLHRKLAVLDVEECEDMLKKVLALNPVTVHTHNFIAQKRR